MEKGEIARYEQFLLFPQCFRKACFPGASKGVIVWEWVKLQDTTVGFEKRITRSMPDGKNFFFFRLLFENLNCSHVPDGQHDRATLYPPKYRAIDWSSFQKIM